MLKPLQRATATTLASGVPTRDRLLKAAEELFAARGYHGTQVTDITEHARSGVGTFYRYFDDKEDVLRAVLDEFFHRVRLDLQRLREGIEKLQPLGQVEVIRSTFALILTELAQRPAISMTIFRSGYGVSPRIDEHIWAFVESTAADIVGDLERAERAGLVSVEHKAMLAHCVAGTVLQSAHKLLVDKETTLDAAIDTCTRFTLGGLAAFATEEFAAAILPIMRTLIHEGAR